MPRHLRRPGVKWFKHDSDANTDAKLCKVRLKYGMEGYGLYWYCLELIVNSINENNLTFELEHDAEIISHQTGIHFERVQEMMTYMVDLGLFENNGGNIVCLKILKRLDKSMTSNKSFRLMIDGAKKNHDSVMTKSGLVMQDKTRLHYTRQEKTTTAPPVPSDPPEFAEFKKAYPKRAGAQPWGKALKAINARLKGGFRWPEILAGVERYAKYCEATDRTGTEYVLQAATFCGPDKHFVADWDLPKTKAERRQDKNVDAGLKWLETAGAG